MSKYRVITSFELEQEEYRTTPGDTEASITEIIEAEDNDTAIIQAIYIVAYSIRNQFIAATGKDTCSFGLRVIKLSDDEQ